VGLRARTGFERFQVISLAVFIKRPQADIKSALRPNYSELSLRVNNRVRANHRSRSAAP